VDISRDSESDIQIEGNPDRIVILEDIVETGNTARKFLQKLANVNCPITLATML
jgi:hypoxanthine-guanine phosphoribosyltransferase